MRKLLENAPISLKVALAPAFAMLCVVLLALVGWYANQSLTEALTTIGARDMPDVVRAGELAVRLNEIHQALFQSLTYEAIGLRAEKIKAHDDHVIKTLSEFGQALQATANDTSASEQLRNDIDVLTKAYAAYSKTVKDTLDIKATPAGIAMAASFVTTAERDYQASRDALQAYVQHEMEDARRTVSTSERSARHNGLVILVTLLAAMALCSLLVWHFTRAIGTPLAHAAQIAGLLANGDLTARAHKGSSDATGRVLAALREVAQNLNGIVTEVRVTADQISTASTQIAAGNADLSARTENEAAALQETASSIEQLSHSIKQSAESAAQADAVAREASDVAQQGGTAVADVVKTMDGINAQSKKIGEIVGVIDGIAFQTNILALNAAVEAARAGEQGRGFAVVAQEVRTLASRSGAAAREIRELIARSVAQIESGAQKVEIAGATMDRIVNSIRRVSTMVGEISRATGEQAGSIGQVNQAVADMDRSTQQNAAMVEQAAASTTALSSQASRLVSMLARFRTA